jgi:hypothetical protein
MEVQSLSICVPTHNSCVNKCEFCVSRTHTNPYEDRISTNVKKFKTPLNSGEYQKFTEDMNIRITSIGCNMLVIMDVTWLC